ncbi:hypothetical protein AB837_00481 [bacterium AB1]|nr:hypothetical protein AB837_00481 [bacterium AB1]
MPLETSKNTIITSTQKTRKRKCDDSKTHLTEGEPSTKLPNIQTKKEFIPYKQCELISVTEFKKKEMLVYLREEPKDSEDYVLPSQLLQIIFQLRNKTNKNIVKITHFSYKIKPNHLVYDLFEVCKYNTEDFIFIITSIIFNFDIKDIEKDNIKLLINENINLYTTKSTKKLKDNITKIFEVLRLNILFTYQHPCTTSDKKRKKYLNEITEQIIQLMQKNKKNNFDYTNLNLFIFLNGIIPLT